MGWNFHGQDQVLFGDGEVISVKIGQGTSELGFPDGIPEELLSELLKAIEDSGYQRGEDLRSGEVSIDWETVLLANEYRMAEDEVRDRLLAIGSQRANDDLLEVVGELLDHADLPEDCAYQLKISRSGIPGTSSSRLDGVWFDEKDMMIASRPELQGGLLVFPSGERFLVSLAQFKALQAMSEVGELGQDRNADRLAPERVRAAVSDLPVRDGVEFDAFLENNEIQQIDAFEPKVEQVGDHYQIVPSCPALSERQVKNLFYRTPASEYANRPVKSRRADGKRVTTLVTKRAAKGLVELRKQRNLSGREVAKILSRPEECLSENLDLSSFAERISGFGVEVKRPTPTFGEVKVDNWWTWEADLQLEGAADGGDSEDGSFAHLDLKDDKVRTALERSLEEAKADGSTLIPCPTGRGFIQISNALEEAVSAASLLASQCDDEGRLSQPPRKILQVVQNLEDLRFDRSEMPEVLAPARIYELPADLLPEYSLHPHQVEGYEWLMTLYESETRGGNAYRGALLADDMGVGKTLQVLSMLSATKGEHPDRPHLVVAPLSLLLNWEKEARRFFGRAFDGILQARGELLRGERESVASLLSSQRLVLTSYETLRRRELVFASVNWNAVVLDEAQKAKNPSSQIARVLRTLKARFRLAATGTPVENSLSELWAIMDWAVPGLLGSLRDFGGKFIQPLKSAGEQTRRALAQELQETVGPVFIRRMKSDLAASLPEIRFYHERVGLSDRQRSRYASIMRSTETPALVKLQRLFQTCQHPCFENKDSVLPAFRDEPFPRASGLFELLDEIRGADEKAIVFCNRVLLQRWIKSQVEERYQIKVDIVNGSVTNSRRRLGIIEDFSQVQGFSVLVLATRAAGVGLNITAANHVIHYTREWNPALENQATDRAYRIGQDRTVHVRYFVSRDPAGTTVDEHLDELLEKKRALMKDFVIPMGGFDVSQEEAKKLIAA